MNSIRSNFTARCIALTAGGLALALSSTTFAKGPPEDHGPNTAPGLNRDHLPDSANPTPGKHSDDADGEEGEALGRTVVLSGLSVGDQESFLRFSNLGNTAGTANVTLYDAVTGAEIVVWESASIPSHGAVQVSVGDIVGDEDFEEDASFVAVVRGAFKGQVQHVSWSASDGVVSNLTACRRLETPSRGLGYIAGPGASDLDGGLRVVNEGKQARMIGLRLHSAATGEVLGTWSSPTIAGHGAFVISIADLAAAATAPLPATTAALTISVEGDGGHMALNYLESADGGALTDLTAGCALRGGMSEANDDDEDGDTDDDSSDDDEDEEDDEDDEDDSDS